MRTLLRAVLPLAFAFPLVAQEPLLPEPPRPALAAGQDTADARSYYAHGVTTLRRNPEAAAAAFYWATRLDPDWAEPLYARRVALHIAKPRRLVSYLQGSRRVTRSDEVRAVDSLYVRALHLDPFLHTKLDTHLIDAYIREVVEQEIRRNPAGTFNRTDLDRSIREYLRNGSASLKAWQAHSEGRLADALVSYDLAIKAARKKASLRTDKARVLYLLGNYMGAYEELGAALEERRKEDSKKLVYFYESKALLEYSRGMIQEKVGNVEGAREAYGRALMEDMSHTPARVRMAALAMAAGDTTAALGEMDLAVQGEETNPALHTVYARYLTVAGRHDYAVGHARRAVELNPDFAASYRALARALEARGDLQEARTEYARFLERASLRDPARRPTEDRIAELAAAGGSR